MVFLTQTSIYTILRFNFVFGSVLEQDHQLNVILLGVYTKKT